MKSLTEIDSTLWDTDELKEVYQIVNVNIGEYEALYKVERCTITSDILQTECLTVIFDNCKLLGEKILRDNVFNSKLLEALNLDQYLFDMGVGMKYHVNLDSMKALLHDLDNNYVWSQSSPNFITYKLVENWVDIDDYY